MPLPEEPSGVPAPVPDRLGAPGHRAMTVGARLGAFTALEAGPLSVAEPATTIGGAPAGARSPVHVPVAFGCLRRADDHDGVTTAATPGPVDGEPRRPKPLSEHGADAADTLRTGTPRRAFSTWPRERPATEARLRRMPAAADPADGIATAPPPAATVPDIGGGHGDRTVERCRRPDRGATVFDLPGTVTARREEAPPDRVTARAGDRLTDEPGPGHDLVPPFTVPHGHHIEECRGLFRRAATSPPPTGSTAVLDRDREPPAGPGPAAAGFLGVFDLPLWQGHGGGVRRRADLVAGPTGTRVVPLAASRPARPLSAGRPS
ncbi:methyltransferase [Streptomyces clavuligerus]|nr:methyltransferase [Streptomyces clavuligerus]WDN55002.1 methyltransferase [Streptomyces clavuligerus]